MTHEEVIPNPEEPDFPVAIIIPKEFDGQHDFCKFLTAQDSALQVGVQRRPAGWSVKPHFHLQQNRYVQHTMETLFVQAGSMDVDLYYLKKNKPTYICTRLLREGDVIHLMYGGHSFRLREETQFCEVKQGPYYGEDEDKVRF